MSWNLPITGVVWNADINVNQIVDIYYREYGSINPFAFAGAIVFNPEGQVVGLPNPFLIENINEAIVAVEVKAINQCNNVNYIKVFYKPLQ